MPETKIETKKNTKGIKPELLGGFRDMLPTEALIQQNLVNKIRTVYERFGFVPLETPCMEKLDVLTGNDPNFNKSIFRAKIVRGIEDKNVVDENWDQDYALRFDLTVSLARVVALYPDLGKPFKRYQIGKVWRGEQPQAGRYREFSQFDFDIIGSNSILADVEVIQVMYEVMKALEIDNFVIRINTRKVLNGLAELVGQSNNQAKEMLRIIDKSDKIGLDGVKSELQRQPDNKFDELALTMSDENTERIIRFLQIKGKTSDEVLSGLERFFSGTDGLGMKGFKELTEMVQIIKKLGLPEKNWQIDLSVARGLDYYTGPVFETVLTDLPKLGSVFSGGRFDGLTNRFMPGSNIAGVGASVGIDRLIVGMRKLELIKSRPSTTDVLVTVFNSEMSSASLEFAGNLRQKGIRTELYLGEPESLKAQIIYAAKKEIPFVVVIGPDEAEVDKVILKNMNKRKQESLTKNDCIAKLKTLLVL